MGSRSRKIYFTIFEMNVIVKIQKGNLKRLTRFMTTFYWSSLFAVVATTFLS